MNTHEWALIAFTLLTQLSIGMLIATLTVRAFAGRKTNPERTAPISDLPIYVVVALMVLALIAALFHLGKITHVIGAVPNLATSWMSREVVAAVVFTALTVLLAFLIWRKIGTEFMRMIIGWITALMGLYLLLAMSLTYMLPAQPAWNTLATPVTFFTTSLLLGVLGTAAVLVFTHATVDSQIIKGIAVASIVLVGLELLTMPLYLAFLSTQGAAALRSLSMMIGEYGWALVLRLLLVFAGGGLLAAYLFKNASTAKQEKMSTTLAYSAFALALVGEVIGRFLFYASSFRIGV